ncbi:magnesium/cobalt transporter CorA [Pelobium manganitolerans]|uniref:magnesium/cobalt transporter CorA n=1 Tax=Pelobium manganitolerans TaxID=1842495 RepID=UPI003FA3582B
MIKVPLSNIKVPRINVVRRKRMGLPGAIPGSFLIMENAVPSKIFVFSYKTDFLEETETESVEEAFAFTDKHPDCFHWVDVRGLGSQEVLNFIQQKFGISNLVMEDIVNIHQRPKNDEHNGYSFIVSRMLELDKGLQLNNEQLSFLLFERLLISFQEDYKDVLDPVRLRLRKNTNGNIRKLGPSYLMYALMDTVIDHYFSIINRIGDEMEMVEDHLYQKPHKYLMYRIQGVKKLMIAMRRAAWPERDKINDLMRLNSPLVNEETRLYLRDAYDHTVQIIDLIESMREASTGLLDLYLSLMSNRMNEVMKTLTIISAVFIPLTFIAGVYGMNFAYENPKTGEILRGNMPELYIENAYVYILVLMAIIALAQIWYFARKGWFKN